MKEIVKKLTKKYPNDYDLGVAIRKLVNENWKELCDLEDNNSSITIEKRDEILSKIKDKFVI